MNLEVYTDGSWDNVNKSGGWAYIIECGDKHAVDSGFFPNTTNNAMELYAIVKALDLIVHDIIPKGYKLNKVTVYSDSGYCVNGIKKHCLHGESGDEALSDESKLKHKAKFVEIAKLIEALGCKFIIYHVSGHTNNQLNNEVDYQAVRARHEGYRNYIKRKSELRMV